MLKVKKGDTVEIIAGKDKGQQGKIKSVDVKNGKVVVEGCNMVTKHQKASQSNPKGGITKIESPIDISNVMLVVNGKPTRVGFKLDGGKKVRVAKATGDVID